MSDIALLERMLDAAERGEEFHVAEEDRQVDDEDALVDYDEPEPIYVELDDEYED